MPRKCIPFEGPRGARGIMCVRGGRWKPKLPTCPWCTRRIATRQCDAPAGDDRTCDAYICAECRTVAGALGHKDLCPKCAQGALVHAEAACHSEQKTT